MKPIEELLQNLARPEVIEFGLVTNRLPSVNVGGRFEPVDDAPPTTEQVLEMLVTMGGSRHVDGLSDKPVQWTTRLDGVGVVHVAAIMRRDVVQARFTVARREGAAARPSMTPAGASVPPGTSVRPPFRSIPPHLPSGAASPVPGPVAARSVAPPPAAPPPPAVTPPPPPEPPAPPAIAPPAPLPSASTSVPEPPGEDWPHDDELTVQTTSPPVRVPAPAASEEDAPKPKPARRPEEVPEAAASRPGPPAVGVARDTARQLGSFVPEGGARPSTGEVAAAPPSPEAALASVEAAPPIVTVPDDEDEREGSVPPSRPAPRPVRSVAPPPVAAAPSPEARSPSIAAPAPSPPSSSGADSTIASSRSPLRRPTPTSVDAVELVAASAAAARAVETPARAEDALGSLLATAAGTPGAPVEALLGAPGRPLLARLGTDLVSRGPAQAGAELESLLERLLPPPRRAELEAEGACEHVLAHEVHGRFLVRAVRQLGGIRFVLRASPREVPTLGSIGAPEALRAVAEAPRGLVLAAGPHRSGKSTTVAALVDAANAAAARRIVVVEERAEVVHPRKLALVTHHLLGLDVATLEEGAELAAHADADVVALDGPGGSDALRAALDLAEAGRLVVLTLACARGAARAVDRALDAFPPAERSAAAERLAAALTAIVGQRLAPSADRSRVHAVFEVVPSSLPLYAAVREGRPGAVHALLSREAPPGALRLEDALAELVRGQKITLEVARSLSEQPGEVEAAVRKSS